MPDDDRLEREINEILDKIERFPDPESRRARARKRIFRRLANAAAEKQRALARQLSRISIGQLMLISFLIILGSFFFSRFLGPVRTWTLLAGVILFVASFAIMVFSRGSSREGPPDGQYWRGREINYSSEPLLARLRRWFSNRRRSRR
ncbi:MAG: hypothetical protein QF664_01395 [Dehalococcoidia bacterium]|jgi:hypothetical protein|nr:hypothetical protein [Dehalococcoidia bacterium]